MNEGYYIKVINNTEWDLLSNITVNIYCYYLGIYCEKRI